MTDPTAGELGRRLDDVVKQFALDMTRYEARVSNLESDNRTVSASNDAKFVSLGIYSRDLAETRKDYNDLVNEVRSLKATLDNNRRLVLTSLVLPVLGALIVFFLTTGVK